MVTQDLEVLGLLGPTDTIPERWLLKVYVGMGQGVTGLLGGWGDW